MLHGFPQLVMVFIVNRDEAERLQNTVHRFGQRTQYLRHAANRSGLRFKCHFYKISVRHGTPEPQQSSGHGNAFELSFGVPSVFQSNRSLDPIGQLDTGGTPRGVRLGEVCHKPTAE